MYQLRSYPHATILMLLVSLMLALAGCQLGPVPAPAAEPTTPPSTASGESNPLSTSETEESAASDPALPFEVPPPSDTSKANIGGTLLRLIGGQESGPFQEGVLYLGAVIYDAEGQKVAAGILDSAPRADIGSQGHFLFENIEPGEYALFYWTPLGSIMLLHPETGNDLLFELEAGDAVDTGTLAYDLPTN